MDWTYKHFHGEQVYRQAPDEVLAAARAYVGETLVWASEDAPGGFTARGISFSHRVIAEFRASRTEGGGTRLSVELAAKRFGYMEFMIWDVGGYYSGQIRRWFDEIGDRLEGRVGAAAPHRPPGFGAKFMGWCFVIAIVGFGIWAVWNLGVAPIIGLVTGNLYLTGRGGDLTFTGVWGRGVSAGILVFDVLIAWRIHAWWRRSSPRGVETAEAR